MWIWKISVYGSTMTAITSWITPVISRVATIRAMVEIAWYPAIRRVAHIALYSSAQMTAVFGRGVAVRAVTRIALISSAGIVDPGTADKGCSSMAVVAIQSGCKVSRIDLGIFTFCGNTIMTGDATVDDAAMVKYCTDKSAGVMTDTAILNGCNMRGCFTGGETCSMTRRAVIYDAYMFKCCR